MKITGFWCECGRPRERNSSRGCDRCSWLNGRIHDTKKGSNFVRYLHEYGPATCRQIGEIFQVRPNTVYVAMRVQERKGNARRLPERADCNSTVWAAGARDDN